MGNFNRDILNRDCMNKDKLNTRGCRDRQLREKFIDPVAIHEINEAWIEYCENVEPTDK